ncbi:MAG: DUF1667 domain-containing protein [Clostridia bacterium]|nr:DUF1667 domain-containing protein [Clostridia bacterium]
MNLTCIICPLGCSLTAEICGETVTVAGNGCPRGAEYAKNECTNPVRTVTATVPCGKTRLPVKTDRPIPKAEIFSCMDRIHRLTAVAPVKIGDILDKTPWGANIVAAGNIEEA